MLAALVIMGLALAVVIPLVSRQQEIQAQVRLRGLALMAARNMMSYWLDQPRLRPGTYRGTTADGLSWEVRVSDLSLADRQRRRAARALKTKSPYRKNLPSVPDRVEVRVCCRYRWLGRWRSLCLASERLALLER